jgi:hypothetical protein
MKLKANRDIRSSTRGNFAAGEIFEIDGEAAKLWVKQGLASPYTPPAEPVRAGRRSSASRLAPASHHPIADVSEIGEDPAEASSPSTSASDSLHGLTAYTPPTLGGGDSTD